TSRKSSWRPCRFPRHERCPDPQRQNPRAALCGRGCTSRSGRRAGRDVVTQQPTDSRDLASVSVRLVGAFELDVDPPRGAFPVRAGKAARLLKMRAAASEQTVSINDLIAALWPTDVPSGAARNIAALVSRLRRALGRDTIVGDSRGYRLVTS